MPVLNWTLTVSRHRKKTTTATPVRRRESPRGTSKDYCEAAAGTSTEMQTSHRNSPPILRPRRRARVRLTASVPEQKPHLLFRPDAPALQSQSFYRRYGSSLPTSLTYICLRLVAFNHEDLLRIRYGFSLVRYNTKYLCNKQNARRVLFQQEKK